MKVSRTRVSYAKNSARFRAHCAVWIHGVLNFSQPFLRTAQRHHLYGATEFVTIGGNPVVAICTTSEVVHPDDNEILVGRVIAKLRSQHKG